MDGVPNIRDFQDGRWLSIISSENVFISAPNSIVYLLYGDLCGHLTFLVWDADNLLCISDYNFLVHELHIWVNRVWAPKNKLCEYQVFYYDLKVRINCLYWFLYFLFQAGLSAIAIWRMYGLELKYDFYLLFGVLIEIFIDGIFCDLFVTYIYQSVYENRGNKLHGCYKVVRFRGYYEELE
jgi:hypothetical protein